MNGSFIGWDIGAVNIKAARVDRSEDRARVSMDSHSFEIWHEKDRLPYLLRSVFESISSGAHPQAMGVTITAELSDVFETKQEGVLFVLDALRACFPEIETFGFNLSGEFMPLEKARMQPLEFAASNWLASGKWIALQNPDCLMIDTGSTTTDILPIVGGRVAADGRTDLDRLVSGELVYTGFLRTNLAAIASSVPVRGRPCRVASEYFAISGDIHLVLGNISPGQYLCPTPDGRPPSVGSSLKRIARLVCADTGMLSESEIIEIAQYVCGRQIRQIGEGVEQVLSRFPDLRIKPAVIIGTGSFLAESAARFAGLTTGGAGLDLDRKSAGPCVAVACLLARDFGEGVR